MTDWKRVPVEPTDRDIADWLMATLRFFGADEANSHKIVGIFLEGINAPAAPDGEER